LRLKNSWDEIPSMKPLTGKPKIKKMFAFDIETSNVNKDFLCGSIVGKDYIKYFDNKDDLIEEIQTNRIFEGSFMFATNLKFDFFSLFDKFDCFQGFSIIDKGSMLIMCSSYIKRGSKQFFTRADKYRYLADFKGKDYDKESRLFHKFIFCDTLNILKRSVESLGKDMIKLDKMKHPFLLGHTCEQANAFRKIAFSDTILRLPLLAEDKAYMKLYNIRDSEITYNFLEWFSKNLLDIGGELSWTISSIALNLFRRSYLNIRVFRDDRDVIKMLFKGYYGGRTEIYQRGLFHKIGNNPVKTYDINSLYPSVMRDNLFPLSKGTIKSEVTLRDINNLEGLCYAELYCPTHVFPYLPVRLNKNGIKGKLYFPQGVIKGYYDFFSIRKAISHGYIFKSCKEGVIYTKTWHPFKKYIDTLYDLRLKFQKEKNPCETIVKLLMNGLYGKFAMNPFNKQSIKLMKDVSNKEYESCEISEYIGAITKIKTNETSRIPSYLNPILSIYVTAYARDVMYTQMKNIGFDNVLYIDTDGIKTYSNIKSSKELGAFKLEDSYDEILLVKPKMYSYRLLDGKEETHIKGVPLRRFDTKEIIMSHEKLKAYVIDQTKIYYRKFTTWRTAMKNGDHVNNIVDCDKTLSIEDDKRIWDEKISFIPQKSRPMILFDKDYENVSYDDIKGLHDEYSDFKEGVIFNV
jgi:hypothetical protein